MQPSNLRNVFKVCCWSQFLIGRWRPLDMVSALGSRRTGYNRRRFRITSITRPVITSLFPVLSCILAVFLALTFPNLKNVSHSNTSRPREFEPSMALPCWYAGLRCHLVYSRRRNSCLAVFYPWQTRRNSSSWSPE